MIDPKQKAIDIRFKYWHELDLTPEQATECAKIAVKEIIAALPESSKSTFIIGSNQLSVYEYWQEVLAN